MKIVSIKEYKAGKIKASELGDIGTMLMRDPVTHLKGMVNNGWSCHVMHVSDENTHGTIIYVPCVDPLTLFPFI